MVHGFVALVDDEDFERVNQYSWSRDSLGYVQARINGKVVRLHRFLIKPDNGFEIDHADRNRLNNCRSNLRLCTHSQNVSNGSPRRTNTSGFRGVVRCRKKWLAQIKKDYKQYTIGIFLSREDAARAYDERAKEFFGEFASLNFPK